MQRFLGSTPRVLLSKSPWSSQGSRASQGEDKDTAPMSLLPLKDGRVCLSGCRCAFLLHLPRCHPGMKSLLPSQVSTGREGYTGLQYGTCLPSFLPSFSHGYEPRQRQHTGTMPFSSWPQDSMWRAAGSQPNVNHALENQPTSFSPYCMRLM